MVQAKEILRHGKVHGNALTPSQKRMMQVAAHKNT